MQLYNARLTTVAIVAASKVEWTPRIRQAPDELSRAIVARIKRSVSIRFAVSAVGGQEEKQPEAGEMVQRLINADQCPEPWVLVLLRHPECRGTEPLGTIDRDMDHEINDGHEPEARRDDQDQKQGNYKVDEAVRQQRQRPVFLLVFSDC